MGGDYVGNAGVFLIRTLFGFFILAMMLRFLLAAVRADFYNPVSQFLVKITNPVIVPLRRIIPALGAIDLATVLALVGFQVLELVLVALVAGISLQPAGLVVLSVAGLLDLVLKIFLFSILIQVVLSWVNPGAYNPVSALLYQLNEPLLSPARRLLPPISGIDLSPILVMVGLQLLSILLIAPLTDMGRALG